MCFQSKLRHVPLAVRAGLALVRAAEFPRGPEFIHQALCGGKPAGLSESELPGDLLVGGQQRHRPKARGIGSVLFDRHNDATIALSLDPPIETLPHLQPT